MNQHITTLAPRMGGAPALITTLDEAMRLGDILVRTGYFKDMTQAGQAVAKILYGYELGIGAMTAMLGVHIIEGKPVPSAGLIASLIQRSERWNYRIARAADGTQRWNGQECVIDFYEGGELVGTASFTLDEARHIQYWAKGSQRPLTEKDVWKNYPDAMLFSRALTKGARAFCAGIFGGPIYSAEELDAPVTIDSTGTIQIMSAPALPAPQPEDDADLDADAAYQATLPASAPVVAPAPPAAATRPNGLPELEDAPPKPIGKPALLKRVGTAREELGWAKEATADWLNTQLGTVTYQAASFNELEAVVLRLEAMAARELAVQA